MPMPTDATKPALHAVVRIDHRQAQVLRFDDAQVLITGTRTAPRPPHTG